MELGAINHNPLANFFSPVRPDSTQCAPRTDCRKRPDMGAVAETTQRYQVHIEQHRLTEVGLKLTVGGGSNTKVDHAAVAKAEKDPALSDLHAALEGFDALTENQRRMVLAAGSFLKDRNEGGYQALVDFVTQAKEHSTANPGGVFSMEFSFRSEQHLVVDYYEETRQTVQLAGRERAAQAPEGQRPEAPAVHAAQQRKKILSVTIQHQSILMSLGEILADLKAGVLQPEPVVPEPQKPGDATAQLLESLLDPPSVEDQREKALEAAEEEEEATGPTTARPTPPPFAHQNPVYRIEDVLGPQAKANAQALSVGYA